MLYVFVIARSALQAAAISFVRLEIANDTHRSKRYGLLATNAVNIKHKLLINRNAPVIFVDIECIVGYCGIILRCSRVVIECSSRG